jgi:lantibiotic modifying enzyme
MQFHGNSDPRTVLRSIANSWVMELDAICLPVVVHSIHSSKLEGDTPEEQYARFFINYETFQQTTAIQNILKEFPCIQV